MLLVDDHPLNRRVGRLYLEPEGFLVSEAVNGQDALDRLAEKEFDLVLMDVHMPVMDGLEALSRIRSGDTAFRNIPVIAFTADAMSGDRERYVAEGMNGFIPKPIEKRDLLAEIGRILGLPFVEAAERRIAAPPWRAGGVAGAQLYAIAGPDAAFAAADAFVASASARAASATVCSTLSILSKIQ